VSILGLFSVHLNLFEKGINHSNSLAGNEEWSCQKSDLKMQQVTFSSLLSFTNNSLQRLTVWPFKKQHSPCKDIVHRSVLDTASSSYNILALETKSGEVQIVKGFEITNSY